MNFSRFIKGNGLAVWKAILLASSATFVHVIIAAKVNGQTTIIVRRTPIELVLGADSKARKKSNDKKVTFIKVCKIKPVGSNYFVASGYVSRERTKYDAYALAEAASREVQGLTQVAKAFAGLIAQHLSKALEDVRANNPEDFDLGSGRNTLQAMFVGLDEGEPSLIAVQFTPRLSSKGEILVTSLLYSCPGDCPSGTFSLPLGESEAAEKAIDQDNEFWKNGSIAGIQKYIEIEIADKPEKVGQPIDILQIRKTGTRWVQLKPQCRSKR